MLSRTINGSCPVTSPMERRARQILVSSSYLGEVRCHACIASGDWYFALNIVVNCRSRPLDSLFVFEKRSGLGIDVNHREADTTICGHIRQGLSRVHDGLSCGLSPKLRPTHLVADYSARCCIVGGTGRLNKSMVNQHQSASHCCWMRAIFARPQVGARVSTGPMSC